MVDIRSPLVRIRSSCICESRRRLGKELGIKMLTNMRNVVVRPHNNKEFTRHSLILPRSIPGHFNDGHRKAVLFELTLLFCLQWRIIDVQQVKAPTAHPIVQVVPRQVRQAITGAKF